MHFSRALSILLCLAACGEAQSTRAVKPPPSAQQRRTLQQVKANLAEYKQQMPEFVCTPLWKPEDSDETEASRDVHSRVMVDLGPTERDNPTTTTSFAVDPLIRGLFTADAKFTFVRWAKVHRKRVVVYRYKKKSKGGVREADIYAEEEAGIVSRIVFQDVETPEHVPLFCRTAQKSQ
ncbi:MAG: hypothetical protein ABSB86_04455 [Bryobacteraceae bacterium]